MANPFFCTPTFRVNAIRPYNFGPSTKKKNAHRYSPYPADDLQRKTPVLEHTSPRKPGLLGEAINLKVKTSRNLVTTTLEKENRPELYAPWANSSVSPLVPRSRPKNNVYNHPLEVIPLQVATTSPNPDIKLHAVKARLNELDFPVPLLSLPQIPASNIDQSSIFVSKFSESTSRPQTPLNPTTWFSDGDQTPLEAPFVPSFENKDTVSSENVAPPTSTMALTPYPKIRRLHPTRDRSLLWDNSIPSVFVSGNEIVGESCPKPSIAPAEVSIQPPSNIESIRSILPISDDALIAITEPFLMSWCLNFPFKLEQPAVVSFSRY